MKGTASRPLSLCELMLGLPIGPLPFPLSLSSFGGELGRVMPRLVLPVRPLCELMVDCRGTAVPLVLHARNTTDTGRRTSTVSTSTWSGGSDSRAGTPDFDIILPHSLPPTPPYPCHIVWFPLRCSIFGNNIYLCADGAALGGAVPNWGCAKIGTSAALDAALRFAGWPDSTPSS